MSRAEDDAWEDLVRRLEATDSGFSEADTPADKPATTDLPGGTSTAPRAVAGFDFRVDPALGESLDAAAFGARGAAGTPPGPRDWEAAEEDGDFIPPEPEPLLSGRPDRVVAWLAGIALPLLLLVLALFWREGTPRLLWPILALGSLAAWGYLVWKMPTQRHDDGDDGARV